MGFRTIDLDTKEGMEKYKKATDHRQEAAFTLLIGSNRMVNITLITMRVN